MSYLRFPWDDVQEPEADPALSLAPSLPIVAAKRRGRRPRATPNAQHESEPRSGLRAHHLTVYGPGEQVDQFAQAARGPGVIPWHVDYAELEQDVFHMSLRQPPAYRTLSVSECRALARQFREQVEAHHAQAASIAAGIGHRACPLDLHALLPIPQRVLSFGLRDLRTASWLRANWGMTAPPRQVMQRPGATAGKRLPHGHRVVAYGFFCEGGPPHAAREALERLWPTLSFHLVARSAD